MTAHSDLPVHPFTGLTAVGIVAGRPVWPIRGSSEDEGPPADGSSDVDGPVDEPGDDSTDEDQPLGPAGEKALQAEKDRRRAESAKRRAAEDRIKALEAQLKQPPEGDEPDLESIRADAAKEANLAAAQRIVKSEVKAAAAGKLADPADAYKFLDLTEFEVDDDGNVDEAEIAEAINDLLERKPYLAAQGGTKKQHGSADGGARKGQSRPIQLTREQLKSMTPELIRSARSEGRLNDLLGVTS